MSDLAADLEPELPVFDHGHLVQLMKEQRISTTDMGARCDRSAFTVKLYQEGRADPPAGVVGSMAYALGVPVSALFRPATPADVEMTTVIAPRRIRKT